MGNGRRKRAKKQQMEGQEKPTEEEMKEMKRRVGDNKKKERTARPIHSEFR